MWLVCFTCFQYVPGFGSDGTGARVLGFRLRYYPHLYDLQQ